jgi:hypothetical protein
MYGSIMLGEEAHPILAAEALAALILTFRDHVVLPDDYLEKAKEIYDFQKSHPVPEAVRGGLRTCYAARSSLTV